MTFVDLKKKEALAKIYKQCQPVDSESVPVDDLYRTFCTHLERYASEVDQEIPGTTRVFEFLKKKGIKICVGSGFPQNIVDKLVKRLGWTLVDSAYSSVSLGKGRPDPIMIQVAMKEHGVVDPKQVVKVGDTKVDVEEGKNASCWTVSVLTGTQSKEMLVNSGPDFIISSVANLPQLFKHAEPRPNSCL